MRARLLASVLAGSAVIGLAAQSSPPPQTPPPEPAPQSPQAPLTFRALANYVEIDALVTDARGNFVRDLRPDEFEIYEDGVRQKVTVCSFVELPIERPDRPTYRKALEPDVLTNEKPFDGRVYMIVLDAYHISALRSAQVRSQARTFVDRYMGSNDLAAVIHVGHPGAGQEFTSNKRLLAQSIEKFLGSKLRSPALSVNDSAVVNQDIDMGVYDMDEPLRAHMAVESMESLRRLADFLSGLNGRRKAVLYFSEGIEYNIDNRITEPVEADGELVKVIVKDTESIVMAARDMVGAATRANVALYSIDPRGLTSDMEDAIIIGTLPAGSDVPIAEMAADRRRARDSLRSFSDQTGGRALAETNDVTLGFMRLVQDNSLYYVLGYQSSNTKHDGRFHNISVRVTRPGLEVRARKGYYAPNEKAGKSTAPLDPVSSLLAAPTAVGGLGLRVGANVLKGTGPNNTVLLTVEFNRNDVGFQQYEGLFANELDVAYQVVDGMGHRRAFDRRTVRLRLRPLTHQSVLQHGMRYVTELALAPGRYQIRLAAHERVGDRAGSVFYDLNVPDFAVPGLALSDLFITTTGARATLTAGETPTVSGVFASPATAKREWPATDTLGVFAMIYENSGAPPHTIDLRIAVHADHGTRVFLREDPLDSRELTRDGRGFGYRLSIPLASFTPGRYVLTVEARSRLTMTPVVKETEFSVK